MTLCCLAPLPPATGQITPDRTLGAESSIVTSDINIKDIRSNQIDGGALRGASLFHSFQEFNIGEGRGAYFSNPPGIENILSRVTGSKQSNILGTLGILGNANLFLINPNGIVFGPNARLDVGGSFVASTANSMVFDNGFEFNATNPEAPPVLTINSPIGLQYRTQQPQALVNAGNLAVTSGHNLTLVGGSVAITGQLETLGGQVSVVAVPTERLVQLNQTGQFLRVSPASSPGGGEVAIANGSIRSNGGRIRIQADWASLENTSISSSSKSDGDAGQISLVVNSGSIKDSRISSDTNGRGDAGTIALNFNSASLENTFISSETTGSGNGGAITVTAADSISFFNNSDIGSNTNGGGNAGRVEVTAGSILFENQSGIGSETRSGHRAGDIIITADSVAIRDNSGFGSNTRSGDGDAGNITINAGSLLVENNSGAGSDTFSNGNAGIITINAGSLTIDNNSGFGSKAQEGSQGNAGEIVINAGSVLIQNNSGISSESFSTGKGGNVTFRIGELIVRERSQVAVKSSGSGDAGALIVIGDSLRLNNNGSLSASTVSSQGGHIDLRVQDIQLRRGSNIATNARGQDKVGGNITIDIGVLVALEDSDISANSADFRGGQVRINAQGIFGSNFELQDTSDSDITATGGSPDLSGIVEVNTSEVDPTRGLVTLPENVIDPSQLIAQNPCDQGKVSEFIVTGRGGLPPNPSEALSSDASQVALVEPAPPVRGEAQGQTRTSDPPSIQNPIVPAAGWVFNDKGEIVLTAYNPTTTEPQRPLVNPAPCRVP